MQTDTRTEAIGLGSIADWVGTWWLLQTKSQKDRRVAKDLAMCGVRSFVPEKTVVRIENQNGRVHRHREQRLLFPGYIFACAADSEDEYNTKHVKNKLKVITIVNQRKAIFELTQFQMALQRGAIGMVTNYKAGQWVRIIGGPLMGLRGRVRDERKGIVLMGISALAADMEIHCPREFVELDSEYQN